MASVGSLSLQISANATQLMGELEKAAKSVETFAKRAVRPIESVIAPIGKLASSIPFVGGAFAALPITAAGFVSFLEGGMTKVLEMGKASARMGVDISQMNGLIISAGGNVEALEHAFDHMSDVLGKVRAGEDSAAASLEKLGINAQAMAKMLPIDAWRKLADQVKATKNQFDKVALVRGVLGRGGAELLPFLNKGAAGIDAGMARGAGGAISASDLADVKEASIAIKDLKLVTEGLQMKLAAGASPYITHLAKELTASAESARELRESLQDVIDFIAYTIAIVKDVGSVFMFVFHLARVGIDSFLVAVSAGFAALFDLLGRLPGRAGAAMRQAAEFARAYRDEMVGEMHKEQAIVRQGLGTSAVNTVSDIIKNRGRRGNAADVAASAAGGMAAESKGALQAAIGIDSSKAAESLINRQLAVVGQTTDKQDQILGELQNQGRIQQQQAVALANIEGAVVGLPERLQVIGV